LSKAILRQWIELLSCPVISGPYFPFCRYFQDKASQYVGGQVQLQNLPERENISHLLIGSRQGYTTRSLQQKSGRCESRLGSVWSRIEAIHKNKNILNALATVTNKNKRNAASNSEKVVSPWLKSPVRP